MRVVILNQDPYHQPDQAHGLCFSVNKGIKTPPSLVNIYKEINGDLGFPLPKHGYLQSWAEQGVLLLNAVLTVKKNNAGSHAGKGWEIFTDKIIETISQHTKDVVFLLWGSYAQKKEVLIDKNKHMVFKAPHPSPLSAHRGFLGCKHFSKTNGYLKDREYPIINWMITE